MVVQLYYGGGILDSDAYVVWCDWDGITHLFNTWLDSYDAVRECQSLNSRDDSGAHYYVTYMGERLHG